jgi:hypothetical protein
MTFALPNRGPRFISVEFTPNVGCLGCVVAVVNDFCRNVIDDKDTQYAIQLAAYELVENLIKYSIGDHVNIDIRVVGGISGHELVLTTKNQAVQSRLRDVESRLSAVESALDPVAHFDVLVHESIESPGESRLGLGRLRGEVDLKVSHRIEEDYVIIEVRREIYRS